MSSPRFWIQLSLTVPANLLEATEAALFEAGALSVAVEDEGHEAWYEEQPGGPSPWRTLRLASLFDGRLQRPAILEALQGCAAPEILATAAFEALPDRDWSRAWMERWKPQRFGRRLWICPTWETPPDVDAVNLRLDPGSAFGTGTHATTALCLEWLESRDLAGQSVLDYGCGSGVLAIAALLLGARQAWACDTDRQALVVTAENAARNDVQSRLWLGHTTELPPLQVDVVVANILSRTLVELAAELASQQRPMGELVLAGILENQAPGLIQAYAPSHALRVAASREGWVLLQGTKHERYS